MAKKKAKLGRDAARALLTARLRRRNAPTVNRDGSLHMPGDTRSKRTDPESPTPVELQRAYEDMQQVECEEAERPPDN